MQVMANKFPNVVGCARQSRFLHAQGQAGQVQLVPASTWHLAPCRYHLSLL